MILFYFFQKIKMLITQSKNQTKKWRTNQSWYENSKDGSCEKYQIDLVEKITSKQVEKSKSLRIDKEKLEIVKLTRPYTQENGYEYTEDFDGKQSIGKITFYYNFKMICDSGGAQTRSLKDVYEFIKFQLLFLEKENKKDIFFINILDGDSAYKNRDKYQFLLKKYPNSISHVFVGDMHDFQSWFKKYPTIS